MISYIFSDFNRQLKTNFSLKYLFTILIDSLNFAQCKIKINDFNKFLIFHQKVPSIIVCCITILNNFSHSLNDVTINLIFIVNDIFLLSSSYFQCVVFRTDNPSTSFVMVLLLEKVKTVFPVLSFIYIITIIRNSYNLGFSQELLLDCILIGSKGKDNESCW